jgi:hypothetical protein
MSKRWLNHYLVTSGTWADGQSDLVDTFMSIEFTPPTDVVFHETAHSGHVLLTRSGETSSQPRSRWRREEHRAHGTDDDRDHGYADLPEHRLR